MMILKMYIQKRPVLSCREIKLQVKIVIFWETRFYIPVETSLKTIIT